MKKWEKLVNSEKINLQRGDLLRFSAGQPFEDHVIMMICESPNKSGELGLITISGYKAGINCYVEFPSESRGSIGISSPWLIKNWQSWVWPDGDVQNVEIRDALDASDI